MNFPQQPIRFSGTQTEMSTYKKANIKRKKFSVDRNRIEKHKNYTV